MNASSVSPGTPDNGRDIGSTVGNNMSGSAAMQNGGSTGHDGSGSTAGRRSAANLRSDLSSLKDDLDSLLSRASSMTDQELAEAHDRMMAQFSSMRHTARGMAAEASRQISRSVDVTTDYVKDKPMQSVAVAAGLGLALGMLLLRR
ncbi:MAG: DUF883 domain-containing protein [Herminiimonas sp.]|nr:DUF883 domain-containing protein [Herminiimonas sp.]